mgnify:CR=1 FL=1
MNNEQRQKYNNEAASHYELYLTTARLSTPASLKGNRVAKGTAKDYTGKRFITESQAMEIVSEVMICWMEKSDDKVQAIVDNTSGSIKNYINKAVSVMATSWKSSYNYKTQKDYATKSYDEIISDHDRDCDESRAEWMTDENLRDIDAIEYAEQEEYEEDQSDAQSQLLRDAINTLDEKDARYFNKGYTMQQIADKFGVSKSTVNLSLKKSQAIITEYCINNI